MRNPGERCCTTVYTLFFRSVSPILHGVIPRWLTNTLLKGSVHAPCSFFRSTPGGHKELGNSLYQGYALSLNLESLEDVLKLSDLGK